MQLHEIRPKHKSRKKKRIGRGGKRGCYSGRGIKGQKSRAGRKFKPAIRELIKKYPKLRGYRFKSIDKEQKLRLAILSLETLDKNFSSGDTVSPQVLFQKKLIRKVRGKLPKVKILGGKVEKSLNLEGCLFSEGAKSAVEKAGGAVK